MNIYMVDMVVILKTVQPENQLNTIKNIILGGNNYERRFNRIKNHKIRFNF